MGDAFDLASAPGCCLDAFLAGVMHGSLTRAQLEDDRRDAEDAELHHRAYEVVQAMATLPTNDELEEGRRRRTLEAAERHPASAEWVEAAG